MVRTTSWRGLSAVSFGILFHLFSASIFSQKVFRGSKLTRVFLQPFCNLRLWQSTGAWQAGYDRQAHGADGRLVSSASASEKHEYRGPRNPLILRDVSASFGGLGVIQRLGPTSRVCAQNGQRTKRAILVTHNSDDGCYSNSEICRTSDLRRRRRSPAPFEDTSSQIRTRWTTPIRLRQLARPIETRRQSSQSRSGTQIPLEQAVTEVGPMHQNPDANHNE